MTLYTTFSIAYGIIILYDICKSELKRDKNLINLEIYSGAK
jgi:hypothetical protein